MAARWGAGEETLTVCNMDFFPMETLDEVMNTSVLYPLAFNATVGSCVCVCGSGEEGVVCMSRTLRMEK